jgi:CRISPR-associated protein Csb2
MVTIELRFLAGRFHATPWGRHVNEGVPEWPPAPFRLIRALYDVWRRKCADIPATQVERLLAALAAEPPWFQLPAARASHTRNFLRQGTESETDKNLVFDPFVVVVPTLDSGSGKGAERPGTIVLGWPLLSLTPELEQVLQRLLRALMYLGRTESIVDARLGEPSAFADWNCRPVDPAERPRDVELVDVACVAPVGTHLPIEVGKGKAAKKLEWFNALTWGSAETLSRKLSDPPALRWVRYKRRRDALDPPPVHGHHEPKPVDVVLFALSGKVLPLITDTVVVAEVFRTCAMGASKRVAGGDPERVSQLLSGKSDSGPLQGHRHAYYLPLDRDGDGRIDHILVRCSGGLTSPDQIALGNVRRLWQLKGKPDVQVVSVGAGSADKILKPARHRWVSATPFVTSRHHRPSRGAFDSWIEDELKRAFEQQGLPRPIHVERLGELKSKRSGRTTRWLEFQRARKDDTPMPGYGFRLEFDQAVIGPFAVGYASHFGLGLFAADD